MDDEGGKAVDVPSGTAATGAVREGGCAPAHDSSCLQECGGREGGTRAHGEPENDERR